MPPAIALAEELESLPQQVGARERQIVPADILGARQQRGRELQRTVGRAIRKLDHMRRVGMLPIDRSIDGPVLHDRNTYAHVEL